MIDNQDENSVEQTLRESLIKSFMVIFTHNSSQHLLLNRDLIDIAFNCLEFADEMAEEAQEKLAKLISIIFKFPQVQRFILKPEIIVGVTHLLKITWNSDIIKDTVRAVTYLSMNYVFVNSQISIEVLKRLMPLLTVLQESGEAKLSTSVNLIFSIANIVKGDSQNKKYFYEQGGTTIFLKYLLEQNDPMVIDLCISSIKEISSYTSTLRGMLRKDGNEELSQSQEGGSLLGQILQKCFEITDAWLGSFDFSLSLGGTDQRINKGSGMKIMENLVHEDDDRKKSVLFASKQILIRNNLYYIVARALKVCFLGNQTLNLGWLSHSKSRDTLEFGGKDSLRFG